MGSEGFAFAAKVSFWATSSAVCAGFRDDHGCTVVHGRVPCAVLSGVTVPAIVRCRLSARDPGDRVQHRPGVAGAIVAEVRRQVRAPVEAQPVRTARHREPPARGQLTPWFVDYRNAAQAMDPRSLVPGCGSISLLVHAIIPVAQIPQ